ncbi:MAG TPA: glutamyl-tRNA reductase, partial [Thermoanaerobaculia bacterium]|nr:glutamyl-tRNA reductase [Thermoanaerobaculia bacterium]
MPLLLIGLNHRTAPVGVRERLSVPEQRLPDVVRDLQAVDGVDGAAVVSTCNRVEAIISARTEDVIERIVEWLAKQGESDRTSLENHLYILRHTDVVKHLF